MNDGKKTGTEVLLEKLQSPAVLQECDKHLERLTQAMRRCRMAKIALLEHRLATVGDLPANDPFWEEFAASIDECRNLVELLPTILGEDPGFFG